MVLGLLSMTLCLAYLTAIPGLVFGIIALTQIKKGVPPQDGKGMAIAGVTLSAISIILVAAILIFDNDEPSPWEDLFADEAAKLPFEVDAPVYSTLVGEGLSGSGFHFEAAGRRYIACSLHQFDGAQPKTMISLDFEERIEITAPVAEFEDVQVLAYRSERLDALTPLPFDPGHEVKRGEPIYLLTDNGVVRAHVTDKNPFSSEWTFYPENDGTFEAMGNSGSPIVSGLTGKVIGVFLSADDGFEATFGGFEELRLP